ncbi:hypothetical protein BVY04_02380, partial [bacterium M21]
GWDIAFDNVIGDLTVAAQYSVITYTVTFDAGTNGTITAGDAVQEIAHGTGAVAPTVTAVVGYTFIGWDIAFDNVIGDLTVAAQYSVITYTVTFDAGTNGTITAGDAVQEIAHGAGAVAPTVTANAGHAFTSWDIAFDNITSDLTVTALYDLSDDDDGTAGVTPDADDDDSSCGCVIGNKQPVAWWMPLLVLSLVIYIGRRLRQNDRESA